MKKLLNAKTLGISGALLSAWLLTGLYQVDSGEEAVVLRFGEHVKTVTNAGLKWHIPFPIETVQKEKVSEVRRLEFGFRTTKEGSSEEDPQYEEVQHEARMLTSDENLLDVETIVQYQIVDIENYLFNVENPVKTLRVAGESSIRRIVANHTLDESLTDNKTTIETEIQKELQEVVDKYKLGVAIKAVQFQDVNPPKEVDAAFKDVAAAKEDKNSYINQAQAYANEVVPKARGNAAEIVNKAIAYKEKRISEAKGDVAKFNEILSRYKGSEAVTRTRMYLETLEEVLPGVDKYIVDEKGNTLKFLPMEGVSSLPKEEKNK